jgi:PTH1 family peptidyl-tRNA hydrolase
MTTDRYLIVGLGNPGREYEKTRHNIGFRVVEAFANAHTLTFDKKQARALIAEGTVADKKVLIVKPQTYMNLSGESVGSLVTFYKVPHANLMTVSDDLDIPLGNLRLRKTGSAGGQNGLKSIIAHLGTQDFARLRFGIGRPPGRMDPAAYVLQDFDRIEQPVMDETLRKSLEAIQVWLSAGIDQAMNQFNTTGQPSRTHAP